MRDQSQVINSCRDNQAPSIRPRMSTVGLVGVLTGVRLGIALLAVLQLASPAWARLAPFDGIGGNGGTPYRIDCGESAVLVGVTGKSGLVIDRLAGLCVKIDPISGTWVGGVYETSSVGGNGGSSFRQVCAVGLALVGLTGTDKYFSGTDVVASLEITCTELKIRTQYEPPVIRGFRQVGFYGDPDPLKVTASQDLCYRPLAGNDRSQDQWTDVGIVLEGRSGRYVDRVHLLCGELLQDTQGYRVAFQTSAKTAVPEGTPLNIKWRASGVKPELTPNLQYRWDLLTGFGSPPMKNPCAYATQPCGSGWFGSESGSQVTFHSLPPGGYALHLIVRPTVSTPVQSEAMQRFKIVPNQLVEIKANPGSIRAGQGSTATIVLEGPAPPGGKTVYLMSSNPQLVPVPPSIVIPAGSNSGSVAMRSTTVLSGQVTITASTIKFLQLQGIPSGLQPNFAARVRPRGVEGEEPSPSPSTDPAQVLPNSEPAPIADDRLSSETPDPNQEVTERGVGDRVTRPSVGFPQSKRRIATVPKPQPGGAVTQISPDVAAVAAVPKPQPDGAVTQISPDVGVAALPLPRARKQTILTVHPNIEFQQSIKP